MSVSPEGVIKAFTKQGWLVFKRRHEVNKCWGMKSWILHVSHLRALLTLALCLDRLSYTLCTCLSPFLTPPSLPQLGRINYSFSGPSLYLLQTSINILLNFYFIPCWQIQNPRSQEKHS